MVDGAASTPDFDLLLYGLLFSQGGTMAERLNEVADLFADHAGVMDIINFIREDSSRPICTPVAINGNGS